MTQPTLSVLDSTGATRVINTANPNGQATATNSQPVVLASDQTLPLPTGAATNTAVTSFATANHTDLQALLTAIGVTNTDLTALTTAQHTDLAAILAKMVTGAATDANATAIGNTLHADLQALIQKRTELTSATGITTATAVSIGAASTLGIQISGNGAGFVLQPQASMDNGVTWINVGVILAGAGATSTSRSTITANGNFEFNAPGYTNFQLVVTTLGTGSINTSIWSTVGQKFVRSAGIGDQADAAVTTTATGSFSLISLVKGLFTRFLAFTANTSFTGTNTATNGVGIVTLAGTDYIAVAANTARKFVSITNTHASATLIINPTGLAFSSSAYIGIPIPPGGTYEWSGVTVPNGDLHVASSVAGATYFVIEG